DALASGKGGDDDTSPSARGSKASPCPYARERQGLPVETLFRGRHRRQSSWVLLKIVLPPGSEAREVRQFYPRRKRRRRTLRPPPRTPPQTFLLTNGQTLLCSTEVRHGGRSRRRTSTRTCLRQ
ncbi:unnamed protein product, partial [Ectocarpus sp. 13 AM-2016]